jgi:hypothetical protein
MVTREDFKNPFVSQDTDRKLDHTLFQIEYTGEWTVNDYVTVKGFVFYPQNLHVSRFHVVAPDYDCQEVQEGRVDLDALELLLGKESFECFLDELHDICTDFNGEETYKMNHGIKYWFLTDEWEEEEIPDPVY